MEATLKRILLTLALLLAATNLSRAEPPLCKECKEPKKIKCNKIYFFKECPQLPHYRENDYIPFRWHDKATDCQYDNPKKPECVWVRERVRIKIRNGCEVNWCKKSLKKISEERNG